MVVIGQRKHWRHENRGHQLLKLLGSTRIVLWTKLELNPSRCLLRGCYLH